jgi:hypothetical protein
MGVGLFRLRGVLTLRLTLIWLEEGEAGKPSLGRRAGTGSRGQPFKLSLLVTSIPAATALMCIFTNEKNGS